MRGGCKGSVPIENHKNVGILSNTGPDLLKNHKATKPAFNVGPPSAQRNAKDGPLILVFGLNNILLDKSQDML